MARIYTRGGDGGETSLFGGRRLPKSDVRVDLYGEVDELNSLLGAALAFLPRDRGPDPRPDALARQLERLQADLLELGGLLADPDRCEQLARRDALPPALDVGELEGWIDRWEEELPPLRTFILPGGAAAGALLHLARCVCRRLERRAVAAAETIAVPRGVLGWLNRLGDYLFVAARTANAAVGAAETAWTPAAAGEDSGGDAS